MMFIKQVTIKNLRNIRFAEITFLPLVNKISGKNGSGKSTIIDAVRTAILGKSYLGRGISADKLITQGKEQCEINVKINDKEKIIHVRRKISSNGNMYLEAVDSEANPLQQKDLDALCSQYAIDPLEFTRKSAKEQFELIKKVTGVDTTEIDTQIESLANQRTQANSILKMHKGSLEAMGDPDNVDKVNISELMTELNVISEHNKNIDNILHNIDMTNKRIMDDEAEAEKLLKQVKELVQRVADHKKQLVEYNKVITDLGGKKDDVEVRYRINEVDAINQKANDYQKYQDQKKITSEAEEIYTDLDTKIRDLREKKEDMVKSANMPLENMEFTEADGVVINGIPFIQHSTAQQIIMGCKIATFTDPCLKVIVIKDGSLLDDESIAQVEKFAEDNGYQVYMELVNEQVDSIIMKEGEVVDQVI